MYRVFLAYRYLLTRPINVLGMLGVLLGVYALVVIVAIFSGFLNVVSAHARETTGDLGVLALPPARADAAVLQQALLDDPNVADVAPRLVHFGLLHRPGQRPAPPQLLGRSALQGGDQPFLFLLGVDPAREQAVTGLPHWLAAVAPEYRAADLLAPLAQPGDRPGDLPGILVGEERMRREGWQRGDRVVVTTGKVERGDGGKAITDLRLEFRIAGAFHSRHVGFDGNNAFVHLEVLRRALFPGHPAAVQEFAVRVHDERDLEGTAERLDRAVGRALRLGDFERYRGVLTWRERNHQLLGSIEHQRALIKVILFVIMVVAAFLMFATLSMMVTEKRTDIGILTALGGRPLGVMQVFLACGIAITLCGIALGLAAGSLSALWLDEFRGLVQRWSGIDLFPVKVYNLDRVPCELDPWWLAQVGGMALLVGVIVSALPALRAARHDPLVSLRGT
jgi:lipoprotein-releasing system permease protein